MTTYSYDKMKSTYITAEIQWSCRTGKPPIQGLNTIYQHSELENKKDLRFMASSHRHPNSQTESSIIPATPSFISHIFRTLKRHAHCLSANITQIRPSPPSFFSESKTDSSNVWKPFPILTSIFWDYRQCQSPTPLHPSCSSWSDCPVLAPQRSPTSASQDSSRHPYPESLLRQQTKTKCRI